MKDTRVFRATRRNGHVEYCNRIAVGGKTGKGWNNRRSIAAVHATDKDALSGWADVTAEFLGFEE